GSTREPVSRTASPAPLSVAARRTYAPTALKLCWRSRYASHWRSGRPGGGSKGRSGGRYDASTNRSASTNGNGRRSTLLTTVNTALLAPIAIASVDTAVIVNAGVRRNARRP